MRERKFVVELILLFFLSLIVVYNWFESPTKYILYYVDQFFPFNPHYYLTHMYAWSGLRGTGGPIFYGDGLLPYISFIYLLHDVLNLSLGWAQFILYVFLFFMTGWGMLFFTYNIYDEELRNSLGPFLAAILYSMNSYLLHWCISDFMYVWFIYAFLPFLLCYIYKSIKVAGAGSFPSRDLALTSLFLFLMSPGLGWVWLLPTSFIVTIYILALFLMERPSLKHSMLILAFLLMEGVLLKSQLIYRISSISLSLLQPSSAHVTWSWVIGNSKITTYLTAFAIGWLTYPKQTILFSLMLPIFSSVALFHKTNTKKFKGHILFFTVTILIFLPMVTGVSGPLGDVFTYMWWHVFFFRPFITLLMDFGFVLALSYAVLTPIGVYTILNFWGRLRKSQRIKGTVIGAILIILVMGTVPSLVTGSWATTYYSPGWGPGARISIPAYEYEVYNLFSTHLAHGQRVLSLPLQGPLTGTTWYLGTDILAFMGIPMFSGCGYMPKLDNQIYLALANQLNSKDTSNFSEELAVLGMKYVMVRLDYNSKSFHSWYPTNLTTLISTLNNTKGLFYMGRIGQRLIYEVKDTYPLIYATLMPRRSNQTIYPFPNDPPKISSNPVVTYSVVSPVSYEVHVQNATVSFVLVFGNTFDSGWQLRYDGPVAEHLLVYSFANGWLINKTGSFNLQIYYAPQRIFTVTTIFCFVGLAIPFSFLTFDLLRRRKNTHA